ncbi:MAG: alpha-amylase/4-alpha-glucanotransferase domain-containing protein [Candidatus Acidiferrales bacterium]
MTRFNLVLIIHAHQPVGNFDAVMEHAYEKSYLPFVQVLLRHPFLRLGLHYSGGLLEWIERAHPEYFESLKVMVKRGQVELLGGGYYEPILVAISKKDAREQIDKLAGYLARHFGRRPRGAWLAERVWEPQLPSVLSAAGVEYTLVDDNHFMNAGFDPASLYGTFVAEDQGSPVILFPGLKALRYLIPYKSPQEVVGFFREAARARPGGIVTMGDDMEKFGVWPGTYDYCYKDGWLERFTAELEANQNWLATLTPSDAMTSQAPLGRADLPACSYAEMMEWALPTPARLRFQAVEKEFASREDVKEFLRGGVWRGFLTKYSESNLMQKKAMLVSRKLRDVESKLRAEGAPLEGLRRAKTDLLCGQANDAYWHGVFGGLYAPHLRTMVWQSLIRAEAFADAAAHKREKFAELRRFDLDVDGHEELYLTTERAAILISPSDGGTVKAMDFRPNSVAIINSMMRRPEPYHRKLGQATGQRGVASIHDQVRAKEPGLEKRLKYDRWPRNSFRVLMFPAEGSAQDYENLKLNENAEIAGGSYCVKDAEASKVRMTADSTDGEWKVEKVFSFAARGDGFRMTCDLSMKQEGQAPANRMVGIEMVVNLLAPDATDRYLEVGGKRQSLRWAGAAPASELRLVDEWQNIRVTLQAENAKDYWVAPIETISESEEGFERVYQGSQVMAVWPVEFEPGKEWKARLICTLEPAR